MLLLSLSLVFALHLDNTVAVVHDVQVDEEISNFDEIHTELLRRTRNHHFINTPDRFSDIPVGTPVKQRLKRDATDNNKYNDYQRQMQHMQINAYTNFDIKPNTIIRTQDSRAMGAEYLNETEKHSNNDCLRWCLETPKCNVAVFAETNGNSCYLFDCGNPTSFRCQFTTHGLYTSSVLKMPSKSFDFVQWKSQAKHENELASLRQTPTAIVTSSTTIAMGNIPKAHDSPAPTTAAAPLDPAINTDSKHLNIQDLSSQGCKHYQFQCRQTKECIAIYNVCDGIPQCADQTDEGPDLHCPQNQDSVMVEEIKTLPYVYTTLAPKHLDPVQNINNFKTDPEPERANSRSRKPVSETPNLLDRVDQSRTEINPEQVYSKLNGNDYKMPSNIVGASEAEERMNDKQLEGGRGGGLWGNSNYPVRAEVRDREEYSGPNREESSGSHYIPSPHNHNAFSNKHSSFVAASSNPYRQPNMNNYHSGGQLNEYYGENYDQPASRVGSGGSPAGLNPQNSNLETDYSRYEPGYRRGSVDAQPGTYDNGYHRLESNREASGGSGRVPIEHYAGDERLWTPEQQIQRANYPSKSDESQMLPSDLKQSNNPYLSRYSEPIASRSGKMMYPVRQQETHQHYNDNQMGHLPPYLDSINDMSLAHEHNLVVQPQVQNDEEQEDAIYDPLAEIPSNAHKNGNRHFVSKLTISTTSAPSILISSKPNSMISKSANKSKTGAVLHNTTKTAHPAFARISPVSAETGMTVAELQQATRVHAKESNSAVLALTLGLCVTALLLVSVGCRLRNIRRQVGRKGGRSSLAHDADYLVNGMYL